jgi:pilus assembly protein CpaC
MHPFSRVTFPALLFALMAWLGLDASFASAQGDKATAIQVPINGSQVLEMASKKRIAGIDNQDQNIARVDILAGSDNRKVLVTAGPTAGITRLTLTDTDNNKESFIISVELNTEFLRRVLARVAPTANIELIQGTGGTLIVTGYVGQATDIDPIIRTVAGAVGDPARVINGLRVGGVQQVQLDVVIARVARSKARSMGFSFTETSLHQFLTSSTGGPGSVTSSLSNAAGSVAASLTATPNIAFGILNGNSSFLGFLNALQTENLVKVMAQPKLCTLSGRPAEFISGGEQAVPTLASGGAGGGAVSGVDFRPFGTTVRFLPLVLGNGRIYLEVEPQFTFPDPSNLFSAPIPGTNSVVFGRTTQRVQTSVIMEDGQTFAIGGMIFHQVNGSTTRVPVLGELPFVGTVFSQVNYSDSEEEVLILITPHLVDAMACDQLPKFLPGEETRSPDDFELFLERILEAPRGYRDVFDGCRYVPAYRNGPTADMFPCPNCNGPRGACDFDRHAGPACRDNQVEGGNGGCGHGGCGNGGCGNGGCGNGGGANGHGGMPSQLPFGTGPGGYPPVNGSTPAGSAQPRAMPQAERTSKEESSVDVMVVMPASDTQVSGSSESAAPEAPAVELVPANPAQLAAPLPSR